MPSISRLFNFVAGTPAVADEVDAELNQLVATINALDAANVADGSLTNAEIAAAASIALSKLAIVPAARVFNNANISIPNNSLTALTFNSERFDTNGIHSTVLNTGRLTAQTAGLYQIGGHVQWAAHSPTAPVYGLHVRLNGATLIAPQHFPVGVDSTAFAMSVSALYKLAVGDYVELCAFQASGNAQNVAAVGNSSPEFEMAYVGRDS